MVVYTRTACGKLFVLDLAMVAALWDVVVSFQSALRLLSHKTAMGVSQIFVPEPPLYGAALILL